MKKRKPCEQQGVHNSGPNSYTAWHEWAEHMAITHVQKQCSSCGLWVIWEPK